MRAEAWAIVNQYHASSDRQQRDALTKTAFEVMKRTVAVTLDLVEMVRLVLPAIW